MEESSIVKTIGRVTHTTAVSPQIHNRHLYQIRSSPARPRPATDRVLPSVRFDQQILTRLRTSADPSLSRICLRVKFLVRW
jgi:hypothetical protein